METIPEANYGPYPNPLQHLFESIFEEWVINEPTNAAVYALKASYTRNYEDNNKAIAIDPKNQRARISLVKGCIHDICYSIHHLPDYFIGDEKEILDILIEAEEHVSYIEPGERKDNIVTDLKEVGQLLKNWIEFREQDGINFIEWCIKKSRQYSTKIFMIPYF